MSFGIIMTNQREMVIERFDQLISQARRGWIVASLLSRNSLLKDFADFLPRLNPNRVSGGQRDIPVERITGSVGRARDYDHMFRPLKKHLRDRWVAMVLSYQSEGWEPIRVYQVCDEYFVEDGHHRVSVARNTGIAFIRAEVWEYSLQAAPRPAANAKITTRAVAPVVSPCGCEAFPGG